MPRSKEFDEETELLGPKQMLFYHADFREIEIHVAANLNQEGLNYLLGWLEEDD